MQQYIISYLGGYKPANKAEGLKQFAAYQQWLTTLGEAVIKPMVPYKETHTIKPSGIVIQGSAVALSGHTVIQAESIEEAIALAKTCPFLNIDGSLEVAEMVALSQ
jgi:hypothetical protein